MHTGKPTAIACCVENISLGQNLKTVKKILFSLSLIASVALTAQVPQNGFLSDAEGNSFLAIHAPTKLIYDGFALPLSVKKSTYVLKLDANGDFVAISQADGAATVAGPLIYQNDTLFFAQAAPNSRGQNAGEIVLTKMNTELTYASTVTYPLAGNARPMAVAYSNNHWSFVYATMSNQKANYTLAGVAHVYADKWTKPLPAYHVSNMQQVGDELMISGTFMNSFRFDGKEAKSTGADMFLLNTTANGGFKMLRTTVSGNILSGYLGAHGDDFWVAGALLTQTESGLNSSALYAGLVKANLDSERLITPLSGDYSEAIALCAATEGAYVMGNFSGRLEVENVPEIVATGEMSNDVFVLKHAPDGSVVWLKKFGKATADEAIALAPMPDGGVVVVYAEGSAGYANGVTNFSEPAPKSGTIKLVRLAPDGAELWQRILQTENQ
jgi:hypothetical protein